MTPRLGIADAMNSKLLFHPFFAGDSWNPWRALLKAIFAERITTAEIEAVREISGNREMPKHRVKEAVILAGRGAGKNSEGSLIAAFIAMTFDPKGKLRPGEKAFIMCVACDRLQSGIMMAYLRGLFTEIPTLAAMVLSIENERITLRNQVVIEVCTNNFRTPRGRSLLCVIMDEACFYRSDESASPDFELVAALTPGLARVPESMLLIINSVHKRSGLAYQRHKDFFGKSDDDIFVALATTKQLNPSFSQAEIDKALVRGGQLYGAEYLSHWRDDLATFVNRELIESAVDAGVLVRPYVSGTRYHAFCDPSGGAHDSFTAAISHLQKDGVVVLDLLFEQRSPFNPSQVVATISDLLKSYHLAQITGDRYAAAWVVEAFAKAGIKYQSAERDRSQIYMDCLPLFTSGRARLIDNPRIASQFAGLERRTFSTGRDRIDHDRSGADDAANSAAGALTLAAAKRCMPVFGKAVLERAKEPGPPQLHLNAICPPVRRYS